MSQKASRAYTSHAEHNHPHTKAGNARCRRHMREHGGKPWDAGTTEPSPVSEKKRTSGQKAAATRRANASLRQRTEVVDVVLDATHPHNSRGQFTRNTLLQWQALLNSIEGAQAYLVDEGAELLGATLAINLGGQNFEAEFDGDVWTVSLSK